ncbi:MAG: type II toxin-antitoxin system RelE/ParE family toxin [Candidatus Omnitrophica bacterium]|nr:type II toxin-antitoxin system RelE/ParE family toxin [Candidatus Omnitrophota bacterium]
MSYQVEITPAAARDFKRLSPEAIRKVDAAIVELEQNPRPHGYTKLEGSEDEYRVRVGDYRILYVIDDKAKLVTIAHVRHRRDAYRKR